MTECCLQNDITVRTARISDAEELLKIYAPYVETTAITFEYDVPSPSAFAKRIENTLKNYPYIVAVKSGEIIGYAYASPFKQRAAYDWCVETSVYVKQGFKGIGCGRILYSELERILKKQNILNLNACIAYTETEDEHLSNTSTKFHTHMGFSLVGKFSKCGYKFGKWYDMIWMEKHIGEHSHNPLPFIPFSKIRGSL